MTNPDLQTDVLVRAWCPNLHQEGARFKAVTTRTDISIQVATGDPFTPDVHEITRPGLIVIAPSRTGPGAQNAVDVTVRGIPDRIKLTILQTPELIWLPLNAHRDPLMNWRIECIPYTEWIRLRLGEIEPEVARSQDGR